MPQSNIQYQSPKSNLPKTLIWSALLVGTLDILAAIVQSYLLGSTPSKMLRYIASGIFGSEAFSGGDIFVFFGLVFHYITALIWTILLFKLYPKIKKMVKKSIPIGFAYGLLIWTVMNHIVLPLSHVPQGSFSIISAMTGILILTGAIGLPLSFIFNNYYYDR